MRSLVFVFLLVVTAVVNAAPETAADRVISFLRNAHSGTQMVPEEWLTTTMQSSPVFMGFGGLDRLVKQSTERAQRFGGLKEIRILNVKNEGPAYLVSAEVIFARDHRSDTNPAVAANEPMIWEFRVSKIGNKWLLTF